MDPMGIVFNVLQYFSFFWGSTGSEMNTGSEVMNIITGNFVSAAMERSQSVKAPNTSGIGKKRWWLMVILYWVAHA